MQWWQWFVVRVWLHTSSNRVQLSGDDRDIPFHKHKSRHVAEKRPQSCHTQKTIAVVARWRGLVKQKELSYFHCTSLHEATQQKKKRKRNGRWFMLQSHVHLKTVTFYKVKVTSDFLKVLEVFLYNWLSLKNDLDWFTGEFDICTGRFFFPHLEDLSAWVKEIQSRGVVEGKAGESKRYDIIQTEIGCCVISCFSAPDLINSCQRGRRKNPPPPNQGRNVETNEKSLKMSS